ncbi:MAG: hypothetical protein K0U12_01855 [Gammaproteobacteria bacterium]|nr:hypothetical protein [Gammaproteobacteria bacterium]
MTKHSIVPGWVYNFHDYCQMFDLNDQDLNKLILDYPGGVSSFNAYMHRHGHKVVSGDEAYDHDRQAMQEHADELLAVSEKHLQNYADRLRVSDKVALAAIADAWEVSKTEFLEDYASGVKEQRYRPMSCVDLPFKDFEFELALCSDLLFHSRACSNATPDQIVLELSRIAHEVRVFPLLNEKGETPESLGPVLLALQERNFGVEIREVPYEQHKGSNAMLRVWAKACVVEK